MDDPGNLIWIAFLLFWIVGKIRDAVKGKPNAEQLPEPKQVDWEDVWPEEEPDRDPHHLPEVATDPVVHTPAPVPSVSAERTRLLGRVERLSSEATRVVEVARVDWATMRIADTIEDFVLPRAALIRADAERVDESLLPQLELPVAELELVFGVIQSMIQQRQRAGLREELGDADKLAQACYQPIIDFATAGRIRLTTSTPIAMMAEKFDLGIWTGFIPTGIAPIFLPPYFLKRVAWWPALAHEVAHDFLAAAVGAEDMMRAQLGLPHEEIGLQFLSVGTEGLTFYHLTNVFGGWFEEIFADVFGTLMIGPAYGYTMVELFSSPANPAEVARVNIDPRRPMMAPHPPRHLRLKTAVKVLELAGEEDEAELLLAEWTKLHGVPETIDLPLRGGGAVTLPMQVMVELLEELCTRLYREPMQGLSGHALYAIPGLDYGPHEAQEVRRAKEELLKGMVPADHRARSVIGGLVLAFREARHREAELLSLAHDAIVGVTEHREDVHEDAYDLDEASGEADSTPGSAVDALVLHTLLGPPVSVRNLARHRGVSLSAASDSGFVQPRHNRWRG